MIVHASERGCALPPLTGSRRLALALGVVGASMVLASPGKSEDLRTLSVLAAFPVHVSDKAEASDVRLKRLREIADAIDAASASPRDRAALLTLVRFETNAAGYVHEGRCADGPRGKAECDGGKATGHFQLHGEVSESLAEQAKRAITIWRFGLKRCGRVTRDDYAAAFSSYGSGGKCGLSSYTKRAAYLRSIAGRL